jgi:tetratricopeptide (TPR) repeat protein
MKVFTYNTTKNPVFTKNSIGMSSKYKFQSSELLIRQLEDHNFELRDTSFAPVRNYKKAGFQKHMLIFSRPDLMIDDQNQLTLLVTNSHDGTSSLRFNIGVFRSVCANGLVVGDSFYSERVVHKGANFYEKVEKAIEKFVAIAPKVKNAVKNMGNTSLTQKQLRQFALECAEIAVKENEKIVDIESILKTRRNEDKFTDLYTVYNVVQENIMRGLYYYGKDGNRRKAREIKSINKNNIINQALFNKAMEYVS